MKFKITRSSAQAETYLEDLGLSLAQGKRIYAIVEEIMTFSWKKDDFKSDLDLIQHFSEDLTNNEVALLLTRVFALYVNFMGPQLLNEYKRKTNEI